MGIALRRPDRETRRRRDLVERDVERIFERDDRRLGSRETRQAASKLTPRLGRGGRASRIAVEGDARVLIQRLGAPLGCPPCLRDVLAGIDREPVEPRRELRLATELADPADELHQRLLRGIARVLGIAKHVQRDPLDPGCVPLAERGQREPVTVLGASNEDGIGEPLIDERPVGPQLADYSTAAALGRLHPPTVEPVLLRPEVVLPALRGTYGREYHYAVETTTTQRLLPPDAAHGAVALAERQTEGRGRLGRPWVDSALMFSVALTPSPPVADWPQLTVVAARAVAAAIGPAATIKDPNDVLVDGRKVAGILAEASARVTLGIGINVGFAAWPGAGYVGGDRLDLLVGVLERLERGYESWVASRVE